MTSFSKPWGGGYQYLCHLWYGGLRRGIKHLSGTPCSLHTGKDPCEQREYSHSGICGWPYLQQVCQIDADIGLLIGSNIPKAMEPWRIINSQGEGPYAVKTTLGWTIHLWAVSCHVTRNLSCATGWASAAEKSCMTTTGANGCHGRSSCGQDDACRTYNA